jgi:hypothetical protein
MAILRKTAERRRSLVAAASPLRLDGSGYANFKTGDARWQAEAWRLYDVTGELRYASGYVGNNLSRCEVYVARVDELGRPGEPVEDPDIAVLAETMFGGPAAKAEALRNMGIQLTVPGECYIVAQGVGEDGTETDTDHWFIVSTTELRQRGPGDIRVMRNGREVQLNLGTEDAPGTDLLMRVWTPHPRRFDHADSPVRAALNPLRKLEALDKYDFAQIDSRLAGAGLLLLPQGVTFPSKDGTSSDLVGFMRYLAEIMGTALKDRESAASLVPTMLTLPPEALDKVKHIDFATELAKATEGKVEQTIRRIALDMDLPAEVLLGMADANHWSAWQIDESSVKVHIEPMLTRICDALTQGYLAPALEAIGEDPAAYTLWYSTANLTVRPNRYADTIEAFDRDIVSEQAVIEAGGFSKEDMPSDEERTRRLQEKLLLAAPTGPLAGQLAETLGLVDEAPPAPAQIAPAPAADDGTEPPADDRALPSQDTGSGTPPPGEQQAAGLIVAADLLTRRALELAGKRLLTREIRGKLGDTPAQEIHTHVVPTPERARSLVTGTLDAESLRSVGQAMGLDHAQVYRLGESVQAYVTDLLVNGVAHERRFLPKVVADVVR